MYNSLVVKILAPIFALMLALGAFLYFGVLQTVNEFAQENIEKDLENLSHDLFNVVNREYMYSIKDIRADDRVEIRISQVDCLDILERNSLSRNFHLVVYEKMSGKVRLTSELPSQTSATEIVHLYESEHSSALLPIGADEYYLRQFYFSPWDWNVLVLKNTRTYATLSERVHHVYMTSTIVMIFATTFFFFFLYFNIKKPISSIISAVSKGKAPDYRGTYEFEFLSKAIRKMMTSLTDEVAERKRAEREAETANRAKSEFLANMSHELRTPLNSILGFAQILERSNHHNSADIENLKIIQRSGNHLLTLINQVLDLAKIEAGQIKIEMTCFDLNHLKNELSSMLELKAREKEISLLLTIDPTVPRYICTDETKLRQVLINLLSNAIKFTDQGHVNLLITLANSPIQDHPSDIKHTQIDLTDKTDCFIKFEVTDSGIGIASHEVHTLFQSFAQTENGKKSGEGTGLGLAISKNFINLLGGSISLESEEGKGSSFNFTIPVQTVGPEDIIPNQHKSNLIIGPEPDQPVFRLLIADDKWDNRRLITRLLEPLNFDIREAENGREVLEIMKTWEPHLILMDIRMPIMDGIEATKKIRKQDKFSLQPVIIAVTADILQNKPGTLRSEGFNDIIIKPFLDDDIFSALQHHLNISFKYVKKSEYPELRRSKSEKKPELTPTEIKFLPEEILVRLRKSTISLKMNEALLIVEEIREYNGIAADALHKLVNDFRFEEIQKLIDQAYYTDKIEQ